jgi:hypothetical protein
MEVRNHSENVADETMAAAAKMADIKGIRREARSYSIWKPERQEQQAAKGLKQETSRQVWFWGGGQAFFPLRENAMKG